MDILDDMGVSKLSANVFFFFKVNYSNLIVKIFEAWTFLMDFSLISSSYFSLFAFTYFPKSS